MVKKSKELGYEVGTQARLTSHKFVGSVEKIFKNLLKPMEWLSFLNNDLPLPMDICEEVQELPIQHQLSLTQLGLDLECKCTEAGLAQKLGVILELGISLRELAKRLEMSPPAVGFSVQRGETIAMRTGTI